MTAEIEKPFQWQNLQDTSEVFDEAAKLYQKRSGEVAEFANTIREQMKSMPAVACVMHECNLLLNWDATFSASWFASKEINGIKVVRKFQKCVLCEQERLAPLVNEKWRKMGIPEQVLDAELNQFIADTPEKQLILKKIKHQVDRGNGFVILRGSVGTGKSYMGAAIIKSAGHGKFVTEADLIGELRKTYDEHKGLEEMVAKYRSCKVLVLDELDAAVKGSDIQPILYRILADRYEKSKLTVITSNETLDSILEILGARLQDRIKKSFVHCNFNWPSYRGQTKIEYAI